MYYSFLKKHTFVAILLSIDIEEKLVNNKLMIYITVKEKTVEMVTSTYKKRKSNS